MTEKALKMEVSSDFNALEDQFPRSDARTTDETGKRYGRLVVKHYAGSDTSKGNSGGALWHCKCDCGGTKTVRGGQLRAGRIKTCGTCQRSPADLAQALATTGAPPCERNCSMFDLCRTDHLACRPFRRWMKSGKPVFPDPEKHPPSVAEYEKIFPVWKLTGNLSDAFLDELWP